MPSYLVEERDVGLHRFVALITPKPFPAEIMQAAEQSSVLDMGALSLLASHYAAQPKAQRSIDVMTLRFPPRGE